MDILTQYYRANPADRFIRNTEENILSEAIWNTEPTETPPDGSSFVYNKEVDGYNLVDVEGQRLRMVIHQPVSKNNTNTNDNPFVT